MKRVFVAAALMSFGLLNFVAIESWGHEGPAHPPMGGHLVFKEKTLHIHVKFVNPPAIGKDSPMILEAKDGKTHRAVELKDTLQVILWMPSMGHGSAPTQIDKLLDDKGQIVLGSYQVKNVFFVMPGDWEIRFVLTEASGAKETRVLNLNLEGEDHGHHGPM